MPSTDLSRARARGIVAAGNGAWIRAVLRSEMALRLTFDGQTQAVPVNVVEGMPAPFADAIEEFKLIFDTLVSGAVC